MVLKRLHEKHQPVPRISEYKFHTIRELPTNHWIHGQMCIILYDLMPMSSLVWLSLIECREKLKF